MQEIRFANVDVEGEKDKQKILREECNCKLIYWSKSVDELKMMINLALTKSEVIVIVSILNQFVADYKLSVKLVRAGSSCISSRLPVGKPIILRKTPLSHPNKIAHFHAFTSSCRSTITSCQPYRPEPSAAIIPNAHRSR